MEVEGEAAVPLFTVCTATYNRARFLNRIADSLRAQTFPGFEWLVVDDGSTDETGAVVSGIRAAAPFPVSYVRLDRNRGMHVALNRGLREARGRFFVQLDSDDWLMPRALERYLHHWNNLVKDARDENVLGVWGLCLNERGEECGNRFPASPVLADAWPLVYKWRNKGDKKGMVLTETWRKYPYEEKPFLTSNPWLRMPRSIRTLYVNEPLYVYTTPDPKDSISRGAGVKKAETKRYRSLEMLNLNWDFFTAHPGKFLQYADTYFSASRRLGIGFLDRYAALRGGAAAVYTAARVLSALRVPVGFARAWWGARKAGAPS